MLQDIKDIADSIVDEIKEKFELDCFAVPCLYYDTALPIKDGILTTSCKSEQFFNSFSIITDGFSINIDEKRISVSIEATESKKFNIPMDSLNMSLNLTIDNGLKHSFELSDPKSVGSLFELLGQRLIKKQQK